MSIFNLRNNDHPLLYSAGTGLEIAGYTYINSPSPPVCELTADVEALFAKYPNVSRIVVEGNREGAGVLKGFCAYQRKPKALPEIPGVDRG